MAYLPERGRSQSGRAVETPDFPEGLGESKYLNLMYRGGRQASFDCRVGTA